MRIIGDSPENGTVFCPTSDVGALHLSLFFTCCVFHPTVIARKRVFEDFSYPSAYPISEDWALWLQVFFTLVSTYNQIVSTGRFKFQTLPLPEILNYRRHANNSSKVHRRTQEESSIRAIGDTLRTITVWAVINVYNLQDAKDVELLAKVMTSKNKAQYPTEILERVGAVILQLESFLSTNNLSSIEKEQLTGTPKCRFD